MVQMSCLRPLSIIGFSLLASFACLGMSGCAVDAVGQRHPVSVPAKWKNAHGFPVADPKRDLTRWWKRFSDPVLTRVITDGLANSPDVASATAHIREARARRNETAASLFPTLNGSVGSNSNVTSVDGSRRVSETRFTTGLDASWEADLFGKNRSNLAAATAAVDAAAENFHSVQAALSSEIAIAYTNLRANELRLTVLLGVVKSREETSQLATWRQKSGEADSLESSQALSSLEQARSGIPALQQAIAQAHNQLSLLCGRTPGSLDAVLSSGKHDIPNPARELGVGIPADTIRQRPDVRLAGYQLIAATYSKRSAEAEKLPSLNLSGTLGINTLGAGKLFNPQTATAGVIAGLTGPIFDAGRIQANVEALGAVEDQALQTYRTAILTGLSEVEDALIACRRSAERLEILEKATAAAREADSIARHRYQSGEIDFLAVLDTQRSLLGLEDNLLSVRADRTTAYIQLYKALGGGWPAS